MNMLFWVWHAKHKEELSDEDDSPVIPSDDYIPSPIYSAIGLLFGLFIVGVSLIIAVHI